MTETLISSVANRSEGMDKKEIDAVIEHSFNRLYKNAVAPVKYWLLIYVKGKGEEDSDVQRLFEEAKSYPPRLKLLNSLREDGTWPISRNRRKDEDSGFGPPHGWTYKTMLRNLDWLHYYCASSEDGYIDAALDKIISWQNEKGYIDGPEFDKIPRTYYNGLALSIILKFGRSKNDMRIARLIDWLMKMQRPDGGWNIPYIQDARYLPQYRRLRMEDFLDLVHRGEVSYDPEAFNDIPSCYWSTVGVLTGMVWILDDPRIKEIRRGGSFVLDGFFKKNFHSTFRQSESYWTTLKYPSYHGSGYWALDSLLYLGFGPDDPRIEKPIRWLLDAREKDGFWYYKNRPDKLSDQWITATVLMILSYYSDLL